MSPSMSTRFLALPTPYYLFRLLTGGDHLHFGYFKHGGESVAEAQENMMALNLFFRPKHLTRVLDAGCGLGATSRVLARQDCRVTALSPDAPLVAYARESQENEGLPHPVEYLVSGFETYEPAEPFDAVLFQESFQYLDDPFAALAKVARALRPGGRLVVGDQFLNEERPRSATRFHYHGNFLRAAREAGLVLHTHCDISRGALMTTAKMLAELRARQEALLAAHGASKPTMRQDIEDMLYWGGQELGAFREDLLSYRIFVLDRA